MPWLSSHFLWWWAVNCAISIELLGGSMSARSIDECSAVNRNRERKKPLNKWHKRSHRCKQIEKAGWPCREWKDRNTNHMLIKKNTNRKAK